MILCHPFGPFVRVFEHQLGSLGVVPVFVGGQRPKKV